MYILYMQYFHNFPSKTCHKCMHCTHVHIVSTYSYECRLYNVLYNIDSSTQQ